MIEMKVHVSCMANVNCLELSISRFVVYKLYRTYFIKCFIIKHNKFQVLNFEFCLFCAHWHLGDNEYAAIKAICSITV